MHRHLIANHPELEMTFMYHRRDGLWLFRVSSIDGDYVEYKYIYYKGGESRARVDVDTLVDWCENISQVGWSNGSSNSIERWKKFIGYGGEGDDYPLIRVILVDHNTEPSWEV